MKHQPKGLAHIGVPCSNLEKSMEFYRGLGFEPLVCKKSLNGYDVAMVENSGCVDHIALCCADLKQAYEECVAAGYQIVSDGIESTALWTPRACRYFTFLGPGGERVEFSQLEG